VPLGAVAALLLASCRCGSPNGDRQDSATGETGTEGAGGSASDAEAGDVLEAAPFELPPPQPPETFEQRGSWWVCKGPATCYPSGGLPSAEWGPRSGVEPELDSVVSNPNGAVRLKTTVHGHEVQRPGPYQNAIGFQKFSWTAPSTKTYEFGSVFWLRNEVIELPTGVGCRGPEVGRSLLPARER